MTYEIVYSPEAQTHLVSIYRYIADEASPNTARRFTSNIIDFCDGLDMFPQRGTLRDDLRLGLRIIPFRRRTVIAISIDETTVNILGVFYGGQDYETALGNEI